MVRKKGRLHKRLKPLKPLPPLRRPRPVVDETHKIYAFVPGPAFAGLRTGPLAAWPNALELFPWPLIIPRGYCLEVWIVKS